jgi:predicted O-linked N-acetylglucosamine transferase (SPINDLY family)
MAAVAAPGDMSVGALIGVADAFRASGRTDLANDLFKSWLCNNSLHALSYAVRYNYAVLLSEVGALAEARDQLRLALLDNPAFSPAAINLGSVLERLGDRATAVETWRTVINRLGAVTGEAVSHRVIALNQMGRVLEAASILSPAEIALKTSLELDPTQREVIQHLIALRQVQCAWPILAETSKFTASDLLAASSPLALSALIDDPILHLANAHRYYTTDAQAPGPVTLGGWPPPDSGQPEPTGAPARRLRIGYVSSDMRHHAVGFLTAELFALHNRARVDVRAYYCGIPHEDPIKARFRDSADEWTNISSITDRAAAAKIAADNIDILVDLNGYTKDGRVRLFGYRPAPCIVNWLGFPGSTGSPHHHYIIADPVIIPAEDEIFYSEKVVRLPCYQPNDRQRMVASETPTREAVGLPEDGFVFCVFNGPQKITPVIFAIWMSLLHEVSGSVLWMLCNDQGVSERLSGYASKAGIDPARLVFAGRMANPEHLARYRLANLFLDTAPYGAHTTASDALWMGVPVLTVAGRSFAARVCASLVRAAGLPELVCNDWQDYRARAIMLARDPTQLAALANRLQLGRDTSLLFDTPSLVNHLEDIYFGMWEDYCAGNLPVPRLAHLPLYHRIGNDPDRPPLPDRDTLLSWWRARLAHSNAVQLVPHDGLLWPDRQIPS